MNSKSKFYICMLIIAAILLTIVINIRIVLGVFPWLWHVLEALVIGGCIAFIVNIIMDWLGRKIFTPDRILNDKLRKTINLVLAYLIIIIVGIIVLWIMIPQLVASFRLLYERIPVVIETVRNYLESHTSATSAIRNLLAEAKDHSTSISSSAINMVKGILPKTFTAASTGVHFVMNILIAIIFSIYLLLFKKQLAGQSRKLIYSYLPQKAAIKTLYIFHLLSRNFKDFIYGRFIDALCMAVMYLVCALILRLPSTLMITTLIAVFCLIPLFGALIAWIIGLVLIITISPLKAILFTLVIVVIMLIARNVIYPKVIGTSIGLPDIWVLAAVVVGGKMLGLLGMIIAVPIFGVIYTLIEENSTKRIKQKDIKSSEYLENPNWDNYDPQTDSFKQK